MKILSEINNLVSLIKGMDECELEFTKKDGSSRMMRLTVNLNKIPKEDIPTGGKEKKVTYSDKSKDYLRVYDLDKKGWRTVIIKNINFLKLPSGEVYRLKLEK